MGGDEGKGKGAVPLIWLSPLYHQSTLAELQRLALESQCYLFAPITDGRRDYCKIFVRFFCEGCLIFPPAPPKTDAGREDSGGEGRIVQKVSLVLST